MNCKGAFMPVALKLILSMIFLMIMSSCFLGELWGERLCLERQKAELAGLISAYQNTYQLLHHAKLVQADAQKIEREQSLCGEKCLRVDPLLSFSKVIFLARDQGLELLQSQGQGRRRSLEMKASLSALGHFLKTLNQEIHFVKIEAIEADEENSPIRVDFQLF